MPQMYKLIGQNLQKIKIEKNQKNQKSRISILHSVISFAFSMTLDLSKRNYEIVKEKYGADMEGFKIMEEVRKKAAGHVKKSFFLIF